MKKLLSVINCCCLLMVMQSCRNTQPSKSQSNASTAAVSDSFILQDTSLSKMQTIPVGTSVISIGMNKDSLMAPAKSTAIIHTSPEQAKIDSIKNSKQKTKK